MSILTKLPPLRQIAANYIGGIGYYALHFAWILLVFTISLDILQYVVPTGQPLHDVLLGAAPSSTTNDGAMSLPLALVSWLLATLLILAAILFTVLLPYLIGYTSRRIPLWILDQTSWQHSLITIHRIKQCFTLIIACCAVLALYEPGAPAPQNIAFFTVIGLCVAASTAFLLQHTVAALWKLPQRSIY